MKDENAKQDMTTSTSQPRRAVKLNAETLRALEAQDTSGSKPAPFSAFPCTSTCPQ